MKIVVSSDWHVDHVTNGISRQSEIERAAKQIIAHIKKLQAAGEKVVFCFLGDLGDPDENRASRVGYVATAFAKALAELGVDQHWLNGNHDVIEDGSYTSVLEPVLAIAPVWKEFGTVVLGDPDDDRICTIMLPYPHRGAESRDPAAFVRAMRSQNAKYTGLVLGHLSIAGMMPGSETDEMGRGREVLMPLDVLVEMAPNATIVNGHYHQGRVATAVAGGVSIPGSVARLTHGEEENEPGFLVLTTAGGCVTKVERVLIDSPRRLLTVASFEEYARAPVDLWDLVRVRPREPLTPEQLAAERARFEQVVAAPPKFVQTPSIPAAVIPTTAAPAAGGKTARQIVMEMVDAAVGVDTTELRAFVTEIIDTPTRPT